MTWIKFFQFLASLLVLPMSAELITIVGFRAPCQAHQGIEYHRQLQANLDPPKDEDAPEETAGGGARTNVNFPALTNRNRLCWQS